MWIIIITIRTLYWWRYFHDLSDDGYFVDDDDDKENELKIIIILNASFCLKIFRFLGALSFVKKRHINALYYRYCIFIQGLKENVFFINHKEAELHDLETKSHSNYYEAEYIANLCLYLLKQCNQPSRITVLTTYSGMYMLNND